MLPALQMVALLALPGAADAGTPRLERLEAMPAVEQALRPHGRPLLVHFWALWCEPCRDELPQQVELARKAKAAGIDVVHVNLDPFGQEPAVRAHLLGLKALDLARTFQLLPELQSEKVSQLLDPAWKGGIPATFGFSASGALVISLHRPLGHSGAKKVLRALAPRPK